jgi:proteasome lid subunit RPN8/RPN11
MATLVIPQDVHQALRQHLEASFPNEGGGFLIGRIVGPRHLVTQIRPEANHFAQEEQYHRYLMETGAFQTAEDEADRQGLTLLGYFHSHPDHPAIPSEFDRVHALPNFFYLIVSVQSGQAAESLAWLLADNRSRFDAAALEELITEEQPS